jgi:hypothetical protein
MSINRSSIPFQVSKPPYKGNKNASKVKNKKRRMLSQGQGSVQSLAQRVRKRSSQQMSKGGRVKLGKLY